MGAKLGATRAVAPGQRTPSDKHSMTCSNPVCCALGVAPRGLGLNIGALIHVSALLAGLAARPHFAVVSKVRQDLV